MEKEQKKTEAAILEAAQRLFLEKGYKGATTMLIAEAAGVTHAMLHYYFRTKEQVFVRVLDDTIGRLYKEVKAMMDPEADFADIVMEVTAKHFDFVKSHVGLLRLLVEIADEHPEICERYVEDLRAVVSDILGRHSERLRQAVEAGRLRPITIQDLVLDLLYVNTAPFFFLPVMKNVLKMDEDALEAFLEERKEESIRLIGSRIEI
ncbi:MAG: TetR/AcrR family transcriptional regulator [Candidatus Cryptobacteroides sp.]